MASEAAALFSGGGARRQSLNLKFATRASDSQMKQMDETSSTNTDTIWAEFLTRVTYTHDARQLSFKEPYSQVKLQGCVRLPKYGSYCTSVTNGWKWREFKFFFWAKVFTFHMPKQTAHN